MLNLALFQSGIFACSNVNNLPDFLKIMGTKYKNSNFKIKKIIRRFFMF